MPYFIFIIFLVTCSTPLYAVDTVQSLLDQAQQAAHTGEFSSSLIHLKNAALNYPDNKAVKLALAEHYIQTGNGPQAQIELDKAEFLGTPQNQTQLLRIKALLIQGKFAQVSSQINNILDVPTDDIGRIRALQGLAYLNQGKLENARRFILRGARLAPDTLEVKLGLARLYSIDKKESEAEQLILSLYKKHPYQADVLLLTGNFYRQRHQYQQANEIFTQAINIQPTNTAARIGIISSLIGAGKFSRANNEVSKLLTIDAEHETGNHLQAIIAYQLKDYAKALQAIKLLEKNNPNHLGILLVAGSVYFQLGELENAEKDLKKFLRHKADDLAARKMLAAVYLKRKQPSQALKLLENYKDANDIATLSLLSSSYNMLGKPQLSAAMITQALALEPENEQLLVQQRLSQATTDNVQLNDLKDENFSHFKTIGLAKILSLLHKKQTGQAISLIKKYQQKDKQNYIFYALLGRAYLLDNKLQQARSSFEQALQVNNTATEARINLALIAIAEHDLSSAKREYQRVLLKDTDNEAAMLGLAKISLQEDNSSEMLTWLNKARRADKYSIAPRVILNRYYVSQQDYQQAKDISSELVDIHPDSIRLLKMHADNLLSLKDLSQAIRVYKKIVSLAADSAQAYFWLASAQYLWQDYPAARENFQQTIKLKKDHIIARNALIQLDMKEKKYQQALIQSRALIEAHPEQALNHETMGDILIYLNTPEQAIRSYKTALSLQKNNYLLVSKIARAYALSGQKIAAAQTLEHWLQAHPENIKIRMMLALLYQQSQQLSQAQKHYEQIIKLRPDNISAINNLALIYSSLNDPRAVEYAEIAYSLAPENANVLDTLGWLLLNNNEQQRALTLLTQAVKSSPADFNIRYHYALALNNNGQKTAAINQLDMIVPVQARFQNKAQAEKLLKQLKP